MSRADGCCADCARTTQLHAHGRCSTCYNRARREAAKRVCPHCLRIALLGSQDGICAGCRRLARPRPVPQPRRPPAVVTCVACQQQRPLRGRGRCDDCFHHDRTRVGEAADRLAARRDQTPYWWAGFADYLSTRLCPDRAIGLLHQLAAVLPAGPTAPAQTVTAARSAREGSALARALKAYFIQTRLMLPAGGGEAAATRRARRVDEVPTAFAPVVAAFNLAQVQAQHRARRAGTKPRGEHTLDIHQASVRDLARFLTNHRSAVTDWQLVTRADVEAFLATIHNPASRARHLNGLRVFFRWARTQRLLLSDPTRTLHASSNFAFHGEVLPLTDQRDLLRRWTIHADALDPNEPAVGLLALLHGASVAELRHAHATDVDLAAATIRLGRRPHPAPLDPHTSTALRRALTHRHATGGAGNPHLLVNQTTKTIAGPVSAGYLERLLAPNAVTPQRLRATRLAHLVTTLDPLIVAHAFGIRHGAALHYLADTVDPTRLDPPTPANL